MNPTGGPGLTGRDSSSQAARFSELLANLQRPSQAGPSQAVPSQAVTYQAFPPRSPRPPRRSRKTAPELRKQVLIREGLLTEVD